MRYAHLLLASLAMTGAAFAQSPRIASDFEIQQMERVAASSTDVASQVAAHLNLGDLRRTRNETELAMREYEVALEAADAARREARQRSAISSYASATLYSASAEGRLGHREHAFELTEEALRYTEDNRLWNIAANTMMAIDQPSKGASEARVAVDLARSEAQRSPSPSNEIDLVIAQYSLATALSQMDRAGDAISLLRSSIETLKSPLFDGTRRQIARSESFQIYSTVQGDVQAYIAALNHAQLTLAQILEQVGRTAEARTVFEDVLRGRNDDAMALAGLARLEADEQLRAGRLAESLEANPFSIDTIRDYQKSLASRAAPEVVLTQGVSAGDRVRRALEQMQLGDDRSARATLQTLAGSFPDNDIVQYLLALTDISLGDLDEARNRPIHVAKLREEIASRIANPPASAPEWLRRAAPAAEASPADLQNLLLLIAENRLTPEQHTALDRIVLSSIVTFEKAGGSPAGETIFTRGAAGTLQFTFAQPTAFKGTFDPALPLRLDYRILGVTEIDGERALMVEPLKLEKAR